MNSIDVSNLNVARGGRAVLHDVTFNVQQGEVFALLGGNGAGKSTTLLTLLGFIPFTSGAVALHGKDPCRDSEAIRAITAYLPEAATLYPHLNAYENLRYFLALAKQNPTQAALDKALDKVKLEKAARNTRMESYSKGMRQKVALALALLRDTPLLFLDEPTSGLDPLAIDEFNRLVRALAADGRTVLIVTHDVYAACQVANRIGLLWQGRLVGLFDAAVGQTIDTETVHRAFAQKAAA